MKAKIFGTINETIESTPGLLKTVYLMLGGKKSQSSINKIILDNTEIPETQIKDPKMQLEVMNDLLNNAFLLINDAKASSKDTNAGDPPEEYVLLARMEYVFFIMSVIELSKLFIKSNSHHFNFYSYIKKLNSLKNDNQKIKNIDKFNPDDYLKQLSDLEDKGIIQNLSGLRDKVFAHTDKGVIDKSINYSISIPQLEELLTVGSNIIEDISTRVFDFKLEKFVPNNAVEGVLKILNKELKGIG
jgi:hypothetical protein